MTVVSCGQVCACQVVMELACNYVLCMNQEQIVIRVHTEMVQYDRLCTATMHTLWYLTRLCKVMIYNMSSGFDCKKTILTD